MYEIKAPFYSRGKKSFSDSTARKTQFIKGDHTGTNETRMENNSLQCKHSLYLNMKLCVSQF